MALCCLVPIILVIGFLSFLRGGSSYWAWLIVLLCPILHIFMMRGHKHNKAKELYQCPECGFWYKEKEWAEKCEVWCKEHKSCNLEITKYAINKGREIKN